MSNMMGAPGSDNLLNMENGADKQHRAALHRTALYREWRPRAFRDVVEQGHVVTTLKNSIKQNGLAHAYLFCGTRGTGKTTLAQILSRAVNCLDPSDSEPCNECEICKGILSGRILDVAEIDAASNNSVDNIRNLRDLINYAPAQAKYKVYIIDEVHMLSGGAFNALLKTLEEPPSYVIFILATTEPHKLPATIVSRCQRFDFRRITDGAIIGRLALIAGEMGVAADPGALRMIARLSDGALRDAISIFDQCVSSKGRALQSDVSMDNALLTLDDVLRITGRPGDDYLVQCARILVGRELKSVPMHVAAISAAGMNLIQYIDGMATFFKDLMMLKMGHGRDMFADMQDGIYKEARALAERCDMDMLLAIASEFASLPSSIKDSSNQSVLLEVALAKICLRRFHADNAVEALNARIGELEKQMESLAQRIGSGAAGGSVGDAADSAVGVAAYGSVGDAAGDAIGDEVDYAADVIVDYTVGDVAGDVVDYVAGDAADGAVGVATGGGAQAKPEAPHAEQDARQEAPLAMQDARQEAPLATQDARQEVSQPQPAPIELQPPDEPQALHAFSQTDWLGIVEKFKDTGNPMIYTILQGTTFHILGDKFRVVLPMNTAPLASFISSPDVLAKLRAEVNAATGTPYSVQVMSEREKFTEMAKQLKDKFDIPVNIHP